MTQQLTVAQTLRCMPVLVTLQPAALLRHPTVEGQPGARSSCTHNIMLQACVRAPHCEASTHQVYVLVGRFRAVREPGAQQSKDARRGHSWLPGFAACFLNLAELPLRMLFYLSINAPLVLAQADISGRAG